MSQKFTLQPGERVIKEEKALLRVGKIRVDVGKLILTDQRLVFDKGGNAMALVLATIFGGIPGLFGAKSAAKGTNRLKVNTPLTSIVAAQRSRFGRNDKMLRIETSSGEVYEFGLSKTIDEWVQAVSPK
jgi:hypothetical protein